MNKKGIITVLIIVGNYYSSNTHNCKHVIKITSVKELLGKMNKVINDIQKNIRSITFMSFDYMGCFTNL